MHIISILMVLLGALFMTVAIVMSSRGYHEVPPPKLRRWQTITGLMCLFMAGYLGYLFILLSRGSLPLEELLTSFIFFSGAVFVFMVIGLSRQTIREINLQTRHLHEMNRELQSRNDRLGREVAARATAEEALRKSHAQLEVMVAERTEELQKAVEDLHREVVEKHQARAAIAASLAELDQIFNTATDGMRIIDRDFTMIRTNQTFRNLLDLPEEELAGRKCFEIFPGASCDTEACPVRQIMGGAERIETEVEKQRRDGSTITCILSATPYRSPGGELLGVIEAFHDVTQRKHMEKELRNAYVSSQRLAEQLERQNAALQEQHSKLEVSYAELQNAQSRILQQEKMASIGQLAAGVAHEINNPMGFIASNLGSMNKYLGRLKEFIAAQDGALQSRQAENEVADLRRRLKLDFILDDSRDLIAESLDGAERVKRIVQDLKSFSRVDQSEEKPTDINDCLETTLNIIWNELKYKTTVAKEYGELPRLRCYPQQLNQVFMNLLINAAQAIEKQGEITIRTWCQKGQILVAIGDTGCGMPPERLNRVFEPFFTTKPVGKGTGLGLSICYDIVKKHGGDIRVASEEGKGSTFTVVLPLEKAAPGEAANPAGVC